MADPTEESGTALDISSMVDEIGEGLGFEVEDSPKLGTDDVELDVEAPKTEEESTDTEATLKAETPPVDAAAEAPKTWRKEAAAVWANLPSEAKNEILKRENDIFQGLEGYKVDANFGKSIKSVLQPFEAAMRAQNMDPVRTVGGLVEYHHRVATGAPSQKADLLIKMARDYGVDLVQANAENAPYIDPTVLELQNQLQAVQSQLSEGTARRQAELVQTTTKQVDDFASKPENVYFNEVADDIANLIQKGVALNLQDAYEKAVWANPVTRAKEIARTTAEATSKAAEEAKARAANAKASLAANVKTTAKSGRTAAPTGSIDDTLNAAYANITSRG